MPLCLLLLLAGAPNLLTGGGSFTCGPGSLRVEPAGRLVDGRLEVADGTVITLPLSDPLPADGVCSLALEAAGAGGQRLAVEIRDPFGVLATATLPLTARPRTCHVAFRTRRLPRDAREAAALGLDWQARWTVLPPERVAEPAAQVRIAVLGGPEPGLVRIDDVRLVAGAEPREAAPRALDADAGIGAQAGDLVLWRERPEPLVLRVVGPPQLMARCDVRDAAGGLVRSLVWPARELPLDDLPIGLYRLHVSAAAGDASIERERPMLVLHDRLLAPADGPALAIDPAGLAHAADARRLGYDRVRLAVTWAELADEDGNARLAPLERRLLPAFEARLPITLALRLTPAEALPARVRTARRMHSHGFARDQVLPDSERFEAFCRDLAAWAAGRNVTFELEHEPFRTWNAEDYAWFLDRLTNLAQAAEPAARLRGVGVGFAGDPPGLTALFDEALRRGSLARISLLPVSLPGRLGDPPEAWLGGLDRCAAALAGRLASNQWKLAAGFIEAGSRQPEPPYLPRLRPPGADELSEALYAARLIRAYALAQRAAPEELPTGWRVGFGAAEAAVAVWREHLASAAWQSSMALCDTIRAEVFEQPGGAGVALVWATDGPGPTLRLSTIGGVGVRAVTMLGAELTECYHGVELRLPLSEEPLYLFARSPAVLERLLQRARLDGHERLELVPVLDVSGNEAGLRVLLRNRGGEPLAGEIRLGAEGALVLRPGRLGYAVNDSGGADLLWPVERWGDGVGRLTAVAETPRRQVAARRSFIAWEPATMTAVELDGRAADWPTVVPVMRLTGSDRRVSDAAEWLGPEDATLTWRGAVDGRAIWFWGEVLDDRLEVQPRAAFETADAIVLALDLDLAADAAAHALNTDDYRVWLTPVFDGQVQGRIRIDRGPGDGPELLNRGAVDFGFGDTAQGYAFEVCLPLTADGQAALAACGGFGLEVRLHDDDGGSDRELRLSAFAGLGWDDPATWACVLLRRPGVRPGGRALAVPPPSEPLARVGFYPDWDTAPYHLTPDRYGGAQVHLVDVDDFVRSPAALRVERSERCAGASRLVAIELPSALAGPLTASVWARGDARIGLRLHGTVGDALTLEPQWRRFALTVAEPHPAELWLEADGPGWAEVAEIALERPRQPPGEPVRVARRP